MSIPLAVADGTHAFAARLREAVHELRELLAEGRRTTATRGNPGFRALKPL
ncbi:hypothetical protein [Streptomyces sp. NPDC059909]|uniref:hypothetical protein n=1 Tax=Streptomyces sp. NPDC059909 TaxID=3346998 RepID=UPI003650D69F